MPRVEREAKVKDEVNSVPSGNWSTPGSDSQNGRVAPADPRNDI